MTGFGTHTVRTPGFTLTVDSRSVNGKLLSTSISLPDAITGKEEEIEAAVRQRISRGRVRVSVTIQMSSSTARGVTVDRDVVSMYLDTAVSMFGKPGVEDRISVGELLGLPGVTTIAGAPELDPEELSPAFTECLQNSLDGLLRSRQEEGAAVAGVFRDGFSALRELAGPILSAQRGNVNKRFARLKERVSQLLGDVELDQDRMLQELALLADRVDISEEVNRLLSHLDHAEATMTGDDPDPGRIIGFILQEMHREVNTMGSKSDDPDLSMSVVAMKNILASLKEQVANVQ